MKLKLQRSMTLVEMSRKMKLKDCVKISNMMKVNGKRSSLKMIWISLTICLWIQTELIPLKEMSLLKIQRMQR